MLFIYFEHPKNMWWPITGFLIAGIADSNPTKSMDISLLCLLSAVSVAASATSWSLVGRSPIRCMCLIVCDLEA